MKKRRHPQEETSVMKQTQKTALGLSAALFALGAGVGCDQPRADCTTGHGGFAAKYTLVEGSKQGAGSCDAMKGEIIGLEKFNPSQTDDPNKQDLTRASLAIRPERLGALADEAGQGGVAVDPKAPTSRGDFLSTSPDDNNVCFVPELTPGSVQIPAGSAVSAADVEYTWSNVRVYVTTAYPGTQMAADLTVRDGECSASYKVVGLWPAVSCEVVGMNGEGAGVGDQDACDPEANPAMGRPTGSGINPDFKDNIMCDPNTFLCVLKEAPEGLR